MGRGEELSDGARKAVLEVAVMMAWADSRIDRSELGALQGAARTLRLSMPEDELLELIDRGPLAVHDLDIQLLSGAAAELAYLTAAWMAQVDEASASVEVARLGQLGDHLGLDAATRSKLAARAGSVHDRFDRSRAWWEEYRHLIASEG